jgi:DNA-3-methyladenine glycosylase
MPTPEAARRLLGSELVREIAGQEIIVRIVETEAYQENDEASHSYHGKTARTSVMFGPAGFVYVYFTYGMHYCMNIVVGPDGYGAAALIRAVEPICGANIMSENRGGKTGSLVSDGPAKLTQALGINKTFNGHDLGQSPLKLMLKPPLQDSEVVAGRRVGISKALDKPWRFYIAGNKFVSRPR